MTAAVTAVVALAGATFLGKGATGERHGPPVAVTVASDEVCLAPGGSAEGQLIIRIRPGFHVQANPAAEEFLVPLTVDLSARPPVRVGTPVYPPAQSYRLRGATRDLLTYEGTVTVRVPLLAEPGETKGPGAVVVLEGNLRYQACDEKVCLRPASVPLRLRVRVEGPGR